jgi:hypothetical protein
MFTSPTCLPHLSKNALRGLPNEQDSPDGRLGISTTSRSAVLRWSHSVGMYRHLRRRVPCLIGGNMAERKPARLEEYRPARRAPDDYDAPTGEDDAGQDDVTEDAEDAEDVEGDGGALGVASADAQPDVLLDVPVLKVEEIHLEVEDLSARVSLQAEVLSLLKLHVGADVRLGRVSLDIKGVDAVAQLKVRLDQVAAIIGQVMTTIDNNPQILSDLTRGLGEAAGEIGRGAGEALEEVGEGAGSTLESVGDGVEEAVGDLGHGAGRAVEDVIEDTGGIAEDLVRPGHGKADPEERQAEHSPRPSEDRPRRVRRQAPAATSSPRRDPETRRVRRPRPE